jgi:deoxycytidylate deaminase
MSDPTQPLGLPTAPELVFGLVAPIGVDLALVTEVLEQTLLEVGYTAHRFRLTELMKEVPTSITLKESPYVESYRTRIAYANEVRRKLGNEALAVLAISAIRSFRAEKRRHHIDSVAVDEPQNEPTSDEADEEAQLLSHAYILRQLKRPEEIALLRSVYGKQFILISAFLPTALREKRIEDLERRSCGGLISQVDARNRAHALISQDSEESSDENGQNVRDAFPLGDVFIDATSRVSCDEMIHRFIHLFFGSNTITPTHDEYGMYLAKSASLRSSDLSRQVGAAIFHRTGEAVALGCNEVPKAGGGTYWSGEIDDHRDVVEGHDPNEVRKVEVLVDVLNRLKKGEHLSPELLQMDDAYAIGRRLLEDKSEYSVAASQIMDLLEFGRIIHAEMSAICDSARKGLELKDTVMYCTTFPCHMCAKHIVAAGVTRVVYLEPYPKSYAFELHRDSIVVDSDRPTGRVCFHAFIGVAPFRYRDLFEKGRRKYGGLAQRWYGGIRRPMIEVYYPSYFKAEAHVVGRLRGKLEQIVTEADSRKESNVDRPSQVPEAS